MDIAELIDALGPKDAAWYLRECQPLRQPGTTIEEAVQQARISRAETDGLMRVARMAELLPEGDAMRGAVAEEVRRVEDEIDEACEMGAAESALATARGMPRRIGAHLWPVIREVAYQEANYRLERIYREPCADVRQLMELELHKWINDVCPDRAAAAWLAARLEGEKCSGKS